MKIDEDEECCLDLQVSLLVLSSLQSSEPLGFLGSRIQHHNLTDCKNAEAGPCSLLLCFSNPATQLSQSCHARARLQPTLYVAISANNSAVACPSLLSNFLCGQCPLDAELAAGSGVQAVAAQVIAEMPLQLLLNYLGQGYKVVLVGQSFGGLVAHTLAVRLLLQVQQEITMAQQMGINLSALSQTKDKVISFGFGVPLFAGADLQRSLVEAQLDHNLHSFWHAGDGSVPFLTFASELAVAEQHSSGDADVGVEEDSGAHDGYLGLGPAISVLPQLALSPGSTAIALDQFATALGQAMEPLLKARKIPALVCGAPEGSIHSAALASHLLLQKQSEPLGSCLESLDSPTRDSPNRPQHHLRAYHTESQVNVSPTSSGAHALPSPPRIFQDRRSPAGIFPPLDKRASGFRRSISKECERPPLQTGRNTTRVSSDFKSERRVQKRESSTSGPLPKISPPFGNDAQRPTPLKQALTLGMAGRSPVVKPRRDSGSILSPTATMKPTVSSSGGTQLDQACLSPAAGGYEAKTSTDDTAVAQLRSALNSFLKLVPSTLSHHVPIGRFWIIERTSDVQQGVASPKKSSPKAEGAASRKSPGQAPTKSPGILSKIPKVPKGRSAAKATASNHGPQAGVEEPLVRLVQVPEAEAMSVAAQWLSDHPTEQLLHSWEWSLAELEKDLMEVFPWLTFSETLPGSESQDARPRNVMLRFAKLGNSM